MTVLAVDGLASNNSSASTTVAVTLTTAQAGDIIIVAVNANRTAAQGSVTTVSSIASTNLPSGAWTKRSGVQLTGVNATGSNNTSFGTTAYDDTEIWWAYSSGALTSEVITVTFGATIDDCTAVAMGVTGFSGTYYQTAPWDPNGAVPATATHATGLTTPTVPNVSTTAGNGMAIMVVSANSNPDGNMVATNDGYTRQLAVGNNGGTNWARIFLYTKVTSAPLSNVSQGVNNVYGAVAWLAQVDALVQFPPAGTITPFTFEADGSASVSFPARGTFTTGFEADGSANVSFPVVAGSVAGLVADGSANVSFTSVTGSVAGLVADGSASVSFPSSFTGGGSSSSGGAAMLIGL